MTKEGFSSSKGVLDCVHVHVLILVCLFLYTWEFNLYTSEKEQNERNTNHYSNQGIKMSYKNEPRPKPRT